MLRVVIDTNIFVSALLSRKGVPAQVLDAWRDRKYLVITSEAAILEVKQVLTDLAATGKYALSNEDIESTINLLRTDALLVPGLTDTKGMIPQDPDDEKFLSIALEGDAKIIVSGDRHLLEIIKYQDVVILTARQFLDLIKSESAS